jgi:hypothetical protein
MTSMGATRLFVTAAVGLAALGIGACDTDGGGEQQTRTIERTVTAPPPDPPPPGAPTTPGDPSLPPLPPGVVAADGTYAMTTRDADYVGGENITIDDKFPTESEWVFKTDCAGGRCTVEMRRELGSGAFKTLTLEPAEDRPGVFAAESTGTTECVRGTKTPETEQRYSIKLNGPQDVGGRSTATQIDAYFTEETDDCEGADGPVRGIVSWRGTLID